jgi:large subunit ribosomal protein L6
MNRTEIRTVGIPQGVMVKLKGREIEVKGEKGIIVKNFSQVPITIEQKESELSVSAVWPRKKERALVGTISSLIQNMITGVVKGFTYKLKIVYSHFPISIKIEGKRVNIENFLGERNPRRANILGNVSVTVVGDDILVKGIDIYEVSQTAANMEQATKIRNKDQRVFLDGLYVFEKLEGL